MFANVDDWRAARQSECAYKFNRKKVFLGVRRNPFPSEKQKLAISAEARGPHELSQASGKEHRTLSVINNESLNKFFLIIFNRFKQFAEVPFPEPSTPSFLFCFSRWSIHLAPDSLNDLQK
mmetsp:Transcript_18405/g.34747  ORF Transcript_18405/g.34747 Transcript_18405/m.34747 type:complete len:121 (+) Transcript_18405:96-458(+)